MKKFLSNYKSTVILLASIIVGIIVGLIFKEKATILSPLGDLFLNLLLVIIVPLIFLNITTAISKMKQPKRLGKIIGTIIGVFVVTSIIAVLIGFASTYFVSLVDSEDGENIRASLETSATDEISSESAEENLTIADRTVNLLTVNDFAKLLSKDNIIALLVFSIMVGIAINMSKEKGDPVRKLLESANVIMGNIVKLIMYYAPIGLRLLYGNFYWYFWWYNCSWISKNFYSISSCFSFILLYSI